MTSSIRRLRTLVLIALIGGAALFTGVMYTLVQTLSERFGPQVEADLAWRALRGPQELARTTDLGLAVNDAQMVREGFGAYAAASDVQAIVAVDADGTVVARHGAMVSMAAIWAAPAGTLVRGPGWLASWAPAAIEGKPVGKLAVVVSTERMSAAEAVVARVLHNTVIAGVVVVLIGALVIVFFTRQVALRDHKLHESNEQLEAKVEDRTRALDERNRGMRLVLDHVAQGLVTVGLDGVVASEHSAVVERWFGAPAPGATFAAFMEPHSPELVTWFELGLEGIRDGFMPIDVAIEQMPARFAARGRAFDVRYEAIGAPPSHLLVIMSDVTEQLIASRAEREQGEIVTLFQRVAADRAGFEDFLEEAGGLVAQLATGTDPINERRVLHTLKGNCALYGLDSLAERCHALESELAEHDGSLAAESRAALLGTWRLMTSQVSELLGVARRNVVEVSLDELHRAVERASQGVSSRELAAVLASWSHEPVARRFARLARHATALAHRLGKGELQVAISDDGLRLDSARWASFWGALVHAVGNAVDHGLESPDVRAAHGKAQPQLALAAVRSAGALAITVADNGAGIAWDKVRAKARSLGLPADTQAELEQAIFADGFTTAAAASETSGRGVGMSALREAVTALGGHIELDSRAGEGTTLRCVFPSEDVPVRSPRTISRTIEA